ncbi:MAG: hypothetical protein IJ192_15315 [Clostridia bacterium]|nr:hypothetical protein [Clostridia bacterium]
MLTEKEKMLRAKMYMLKLAGGINPIDGTSVSGDSVVTNERLKNCFLYIAEVLDNAANSDIQKTAKPKRTSSRLPFSVDESLLDKVSVSEEPQAVSQIAKSVNEIMGRDGMKKLQAKAINDWLVSQGYLSNEEEYKGSTRRVPTEKSKEIGIITRQGMGTFGAYTIILYSEQAQRFIIDHLMDIVKFYDANSEK